MEMTEKLLQRARQSLYNREEISPQLCQTAMNEARQITSSKEIPEAMLLDLAMFRLKLHLKTVEIEEWEMALARDTVRLAQSLKSEDGKPGVCAHGQRASEFDDPGAKIWLKFGG